MDWTPRADGMGRADGMSRGALLLGIGRSWLCRRIVSRELMTVPATECLDG